MVILIPKSKKRVLKTNRIYTRKKFKGFWQYSAISKEFYQVEPKVIQEWHDIKT